MFVSLASSVQHHNRSIDLNEKFQSRTQLIAEIKNVIKAHQVHRTRTFVNLALISKHQKLITKQSMSASQNQLQNFKDQQKVVK
jgi:hypothetical protein